MGEKKLCDDPYLNLNKRNVGALADFIPCWPEIMNNSYSRDGIYRSFIKNGMGDSALQTCPSWDAMIAALSRQPEIWELKLIEDNLQELYDLQTGKGYIKGKYLDWLGFPVDLDFFVVEKLRDSSFEPYQ